MEVETLNATHATLWSLTLAVSQVVLNKAFVNDHVLSLWTLIVDSFVIDPKACFQVREVLLI
jgi:hypothetical protein